MTFAEAVEELQETLGIEVSDSTVRRLTLQTGALIEQIETEQAQPQEAAKHLAFPLQEPAARMAMSNDGAMVPLRGGGWAEVKTLVIGEVLAEADQANGAKTRKHTYFSRLTDAVTFADLASMEIRRRGIDRAKNVCAVQDGAEWLQGFVDGHRRDALRILDFAHVSEYLGQIAEQAQQLGYHLPGCWLQVLLHQLKHHGPNRVLAHLQRMHKRWPALSSVGEARRYLGKRIPQLQYPDFLKAGWPIGSGMGESSHKVVWQGRLKGPGMHWDPKNVNPMLALRNALRNDRWHEKWQHQQQRQHADRRARRQQRAERRRAHLMQRLRVQFWRMALLWPRQAPSPQSKGRTEAQKRWGRQTFSRKALPSHSAKI